MRNDYTYAGPAANVELQKDRVLGPMPRRPGDTAKLPDSWSPPDRWGIRVPTFTPPEPRVNMWPLFRFVIGLIIVLAAWDFITGLIAQASRVR